MKIFKYTGGTSDWRWEWNVLWWWCWCGVVVGWHGGPTVAGVETQQDWRLRAVSGYPDTRADWETNTPPLLLTDTRPVSTVNPSLHFTPRQVSSVHLGTVGVWTEKVRNKRSNSLHFFDQICLLISPVQSVRRSSMVSQCLVLWAGPFVMPAARSSLMCVVSCGVVWCGVVWSYYDASPTRLQSLCTISVSNH